MSSFKLPTPHPTLSRNGFDLSSRRIFSAPAGALLPVLTQEVNPGEHFSISVQDLVRTQPLNTAAFARCKEYYHFFFVPYRALWSSSDRFFAGVTNGDRSFRDPKDLKGDISSFSDVPNSVPSFDLLKFLDALGSNQSRGNAHNGGNDPYEIPYSKKKNPTSGPSLSPTIPGTRSSAGADHDVNRDHDFNFRDYYRLDDSKPFDASKDPNKDVHGYSYAYGAYRLMNLLEYGVSSDGRMILPYYDDKNKKLSNRYVYFPISLDKNKELLTLKSYHVSAFRPLAYQRIYNDFYRNQQWEKADPTCFNVDYMYKGGLMDNNEVYNLFNLRYRYWQKDWLTSALPSVLYTEGMFNLPTFTNGFQEPDLMRGFADTSVIVNTDTTNYLSVADIKAAFALEKMLEATRRANGLDYSSQIAAHYGFKVPESRRDCAQFIGGFDNTVAISEVISTANGTAVDPTTKASSPSVTGQMFGKGIGSMNSGKINFDVKEHGLIMCIYSIAPQVDYNAEFMNPFNRKLDRMDYFQPEFQNLGLQPILQSDLCFTTNTDVNNGVLGYTSRYAEYKNSRDLVFGEFQSFGSLSAWTTPRMNTYTYKGDDKKQQSFLSLRNFMIDPKVLDPIFSFNYDGRTMTDQFMINSYFDVKAVRPMSVVGSMNL
ncbi:MAG: major capsid protein [Prevotella bivia]|nr:major capsid protein [Prevotella bivia]